MKKNEMKEIIKKRIIKGEQTEKDTRGTNHPQVLFTRNFERGVMVGLSAVLDALNNNDVMLKCL